MFRMETSTSSRISALTAFGDDGTQLMALEELNQMLSLGQQGEVRVSAYVPSLVRIVERSDGNPEMVLMAVRAIIQIVDIEPRAGALAVGEGLIPALCERLLSISDLDVAEQCVKCLNVLSASHAREVLLAGGLKAITAFFDFFPQHLQRRAVETAATLCLDAGRQADDAVKILEALPSLKSCLDSSDERIAALAVQCFTRLVTCYSTSNSGKPGTLKPPFEVMQTWQAFTSASRVKDPERTSLDLDLSPFQPNYSPQWRKQVLTLISTENVVGRILAMAKKSSGDESSHLLSALARVSRTCPHVIPVLLKEGILDVIKEKLSATGSSKSGEGLTQALRLIQAFLPPAPHTKSFDRTADGELCDRDRYDGSLVLPEDERVAAADRRTMLIEKVRQEESEAEGNQHDLNAGLDDEEDPIWACPMCTYHNPKSASSCEICGQVSPQIAQRASRMESNGGQQHGGGEPASDASASLEKLLSPWEERTLGVKSCSQLFKEQPELLQTIARELLPDLAQVAAKAANPDHRTRALGALSSLLYCAPRPLLEEITRTFGPGGPHYVGVVHSGLQSQSPHVVGSALRVAMVELWRLGISSGLKREGIPQLIRGLGSRFHEASPNVPGDKDRVSSLRRRAAIWLAHFDYLVESGAMQAHDRGLASLSESAVLVQLRSIADRLPRVHQAPEEDFLSSGLQRKVSISPKVPMEDETPPNKKRRRMTGHGSSSGMTPLPPTAVAEPVAAPHSDKVSEYRGILSDLSEILRHGVVSSEFQSSGLALVMAGLANTRPEFVQALREVFDDGMSLNALVRTLHDALDGAEKFPVIKYGQSTNDSYRALKSHFRIVLQPMPVTLKRLRKLAKPALGTDESDEDMFSFALKLDPLTGVKQLESFAWDQIKAKITELRSLRASGQATKRMGHSLATHASSSTLDSDRDDNKYAILQAGDPVFVLPLMKPGMRVTRGRDWKWGDQDGGPGRTGVVTDIRSWNGHPNSCIRVRWDTNKSTNVYRYNVENAFDLALAPRTPSRPVKPSGKSSASETFAKCTDIFRRTLKRGDEVDVMDSFHRWYPGTVRVVVPKKDNREGAARIAFEGFSARYDEWIPLNSDRLAPRKSRLFEDGGFALGEVDDAAEEILDSEAVVMGMTSLRRSTEEPSASLILDSGPTHTEDEGGEDEPAVKELPTSSRVKCPNGGMIIHSGVTVQMKRPDEDTWQDVLVLQLGMKTAPPRDQESSDTGKNGTTASTDEDDPMAGMEQQAEEDGEKQEEEQVEEVESKTADEVPDIAETALANPVNGSSTTNSSSKTGASLEGQAGVTFYAFLKPLAVKEGEDEEEDDDDDEDRAEWISLEEVEIRPSISGGAVRKRHSSSASSTGDGKAEKEDSSLASIGEGSQGFVKMGIFNREGWVPVVILEEHADDFHVQTRFGDVAESNFHIPRGSFVTSAPRGEYAPSSKDLKSLMKAVREIEDLEQRDPTGMVARLLGRTPNASSEPVGSSNTAGGTRGTGTQDGAADDADEDLLEDDVSRSPAPLPADILQAATMDDEQRAKLQRLERAKALFASARSRTLHREYSGVDITSELTASSLHHTLSAAAAMATRLSLGSGDDLAMNGGDDTALGKAHKQLFDSPVRLLARNHQDETIHLCLARLAAKSNYQDALSGITCMEYAIDFTNTNFQAFEKSVLTVPVSSAPISLLSAAQDEVMVEVSGAVSVLPGKLYAVESNFPTMCVKGIELSEPNTKWYYEVEIVLGGLAQIGWIDSECGCDDAAGRGCGDDHHGWAFDGKRKVKWHRENGDWGQTWSDGDVLGVAVHIKENNTCDILFSLNGSFAPPMGLAYENASFSGALRPAITFNKTFSCRVKLSDFRFSPPDESFRAVGSVMPARKQEQEEDAMSVEASSRGTTPIPATGLHAASEEEEEPSDLPVDQSFFDTIFDQADSLPPAAQVLRLLADLSLCEPQDLVNRRLTNKLVWQLQDALTVSSGALPQWCLRAVHEYPFLFPLETRQVLFASTALGVSRGLHRFANEFDQESAVQGRAQRAGGLYDSVPSSIGIQLRRQKVVLPRARALESAVRLMQKFASQKCVLTVEFSDETGHGLGPTLEFYSIVCRELQRKDLGLWRTEDHSATTTSISRVETVPEDAAADAYVFCINGLFPAVLPAGAPDALRARILNLFRFLGRFLARVILDERMLDLDFSELFLEQIMGLREEEEDVEELLAALAEVDPTFAKSLDNIYRLGVEYERLAALPPSTARDHARAAIAEQVDSLQLDAGVLPGTADIRLSEFDADTPVTADICIAFVRAVAKMVCFTGIREQVEACREGFGQSFAPESLRAFTTAELRAWLGGARDDEPWRSDDISSNMILRDYARDSTQITNLVEVLCELDKEERRLFLRFLTGAPRLPVGGWAALKPKMTVVKKSEVDVLPSCSTCAVVLKLPQYPNKSKLKEKLLLAIREGQNFFSMD